MMAVKNILFFLSFLLVSGVNLMASTGVLHLSGTTYEVPDKMSGCNIVVFQNGIPSLYTRSDEDGAFNINLGIGNDYIIEFEKEGYRARQIEIKSSNATIDGSIDHYFDGLTIDLYKIQDANISLESNVYAKIIFDPSAGNFTYDLRYNQSIQRSIEKVWNQVSRSRIIRDKKYTTALKAGDSHFEDKEYLEAKNQYHVSLQERPEAWEPKEKIALIDELMGAHSFEVVAHKKLEELEIREWNKIIQIKIYFEDDKKNTLKKVSYNYGGIFYFKNNQPIANYLWDTFNPEAHR